METAHVLDPAVEEEPSRPFPLSTPARGLLAILSLGAAIIHLVMVPPHSAEWLPQGIAFALAGWFQIGFAAAVLGKPSKRWLTLGIVANLAFIAAWAVTRTYGMPFGPDAGAREAATLVDLTCVGLESALILASLVFSAKPRLGEELDASFLVAASVVPVGVIMLTTAVLASPDARNHGDHGGAHDDAVTNVAAGGGSDHAMDHGAMDHSNGAMDHTNMDHGNGAGDHSADHGHGNDASAVPASARCDWEFNTTTFWAANPPTADDGSHAHHHDGGGESSAPTDGSTPAVGNKAGLQWWKPMTNPADCAKLKSDIDAMEALAKKYPTAQSALDAGCVQVTLYVPGIARHIACFKYWMDDSLDPSTPEMLLYGGNQPWAPIVGASYYTYAPTQPGAEWVFGQMPFHIHEGLCVKGTLVIGGDGSDKASCEAQGGKVMGKTGFMGHYWLPTCSSPDGVFSADNPRLDMSVAKYNDDPKFDPSKGGDPTVLQTNPCAGSKMTDQPAFGPPPAGGSNETASAPTK